MHRRAATSCGHPITAATPSPSASAPPAPAAPTVQPVTAAELGASWRPGCPVEPEQLRRVGVDHIGFDGQTHRGELIVHHDLVPQVITIFEQLYRLGFPIEMIRTVDQYPAADDELSMADSDTSAFNCRGIHGTNQWSQHAYGRAIDLNPLLNPYIDGSGAFQPKNTAAYLDRGRTDPGLVHNTDPAVHIFTDRGWRWVATGRPRSTTSTSSGPDRSQTTRPCLVRVPTARTVGTRSGRARGGLAGQCGPTCAESAQSR